MLAFLVQVVLAVPNKFRPGLVQPWIPPICLGVANSNKAVITRKEKRSDIHPSVSIAIPSWGYFQALNGNHGLLAPDFLDPMHWFSGCTGSNAWSALQWQTMTVHDSSGVSVTMSQGHMLVCRSCEHRSMTGRMQDSTMQSAPPQQQEFLRRPGLRPSFPQRSAGATR
jgi:hypothetical protein